MPSGGSKIRFCPDLPEERLRGGDLVVPLARMPFILLRRFVLESGRLLNKEEILRRV